MNGLIVNFLVYYIVSKFSVPVSYEKQEAYHGLLTSVLYKTNLSHEKAYTSA